MSIHSLRNAVNWALMVALVLGTGAFAQAANNSTGDESDGKVVKIGRSNGDDQPNLPPPDDNSADRDVPVPHLQMPKYWIGILGGQITPDSPLRAHLDLPENGGLIVANVVPDSPAAKAGLKQHDILLKANGKDLHEMGDLQELVLSEGPNKGEIKLDVLRHNKGETLTLKPEERPANAPVPNEAFGFGQGNMPRPDALLGNLPFEFRNFGNGMILGGGGGVGAGMSNLPNGVSISIQKQNDQPAQITVKRGDETWNVTGDDPEALKKLPEDIRPHVERMLHGQPTVNFPRFENRNLGPGLDDGRLHDRLERMEQRLEQLQKRLGNDDNHAEKPESQSESSK